MNCSEDNCREGDYSNARLDYAKEILEDMMVWHPFFFLEELPEDWSASEFNPLVVCLCSFMYDLARREFKVFDGNFFGQVVVSNIYHPKREVKRYIWVNSTDSPVWWLKKPMLTLLRKYGWTIHR